ncbi:MAG TPA: sterol carrier family protein [Micromonosporaceae bacterium]|nr:sterol carrier family protein [Micromonosporaceae bacterium]
MSPAHSKSEAVLAVSAALDAGVKPQPAALREAVRALLADLAERAPGRSVEVRVPPYGAIQCGAGPRHTRGTPPNVIETDPLTWVALATGRLSWTEALATGRVRASGNRADISAYLPGASS